MKYNRIDNNIYIKNDDENQLFIISDCFLETSGIVNLNNSKRKVIYLKINKNKKGHQDFIDKIKEIYNECSEYIETDDDFNPNTLLNPLKKINDVMYDLMVYITDWDGNLITTFYDVKKENEIIKLETIEDKHFSMYVAIQFEKVSLSLKNNNAYMNIILKEAYVNNIKNKINNKIIDYKKVLIAINNETKESDKNRY